MIDPGNFACKKPDPESVTQDTINTDLARYHERVEYLEKRRKALSEEEEHICKELEACHQVMSGFQKAKSLYDEPGGFREMAQDEFERKISETTHVKY